MYAETDFVSEFLSRSRIFEIPRFENLRGLTSERFNHCKLSEYGMKLFISLILDCEIVLEFLEWGMSTVYIRVDRVLGAIFSENYRFDIAWRS